MGNVWLRVDWSQSGDGKGSGLGRETGGRVEGPFWLPGVVVSGQALQFSPNFEPNISCIYTLSTPILDVISTLYAYEDGTDIKFRNVGIAQTPGGYPKDTIRSPVSVL